LRGAWPCESEKEYRGQIGARPARELNGSLGGACSLPLGQDTKQLS
jgi:hypothetical protein